MRKLFTFLLMAFVLVAAKVNAQVVTIIDDDFENREGWTLTPSLENSAAIFIQQPVDVGTPYNYVLQLSASGNGDRGSMKNLGELALSESQRLVVSFDWQMGAVTTSHTAGGYIKLVDADRNLIMGLNVDNYNDNNLHLINLDPLQVDAPRSDATRVVPEGGTFQPNTWVSVEVTLNFMTKTVDKVSLSSGAVIYEAMDLPFCSENAGMLQSVEFLAERYFLPWDTQIDNFKVYYNNPDPVLAAGATVIKDMGADVTVSSVGNTDGDKIIAFGFYYSATNDSPTAADETAIGVLAEGASITDGFTGTLTGLSPRTKYYVRSFVETVNATVYGAVTEFDFGSLIVNATEVSAVNYEGATLSSSAVNTTGVETVRFGFVYNEDKDVLPTIDDTVVESVLEEGSTINNGFTTTLTGLVQLTTYYVRSFVTTEKETGYGEVVSFTTEAGDLTIGAVTVSNLSATGATISSSASNTTAYEVTAYGFYYSATNEEPTAEDAIATLAGGSTYEEFSADLSGLEMGTTYYVRSFVTTTDTTIYSAVNSFNTEREIELPGNLVPLFSEDFNGLDALPEGWSTNKGIWGYAADVSLANNNFRLTGGGSGLRGLELTFPSVTELMEQEDTKNVMVQYDFIVDKSEINQKNTFFMSFLAESQKPVFTVYLAGNDGYFHYWNQDIEPEVYNTDPDINPETGAETYWGASFQRSGEGDEAEDQLQATNELNEGTRIGEEEGLVFEKGKWYTLTAELDFRRKVVTSLTISATYEEDGAVVTVEDMPFITEEAEEVSKVAMANTRGTNAGSGVSTDLDASIDNFILGVLPSTGSIFADITVVDETQITDNSVVVSSTVTNTTTAYETLEYGFCYSKRKDNTTANNKFEVEQADENGNITATITGLDYETTYYIRSYIITTDGTEYGEEVSFKTQQYGYGINGSDYGKEPESVEYYDLAGKKVSESAKGFVIAKVKYVDGTTANIKMFNK